MELQTFSVAFHYVIEIPKSDEEETIARPPYIKGIVAETIEDAARCASAVLCSSTLFTNFTMLLGRVPDEFYDTEKLIGLRINGSNPIESVQRTKEEDVELYVNHGISSRLIPCEKGFRVIGTKSPLVLYCENKYDQRKKILTKEVSVIFSILYKNGFLFTLRRQVGTNNFTANTEGQLGETLDEFLKQN